MEFKLLTLLSLVALVGTHAMSPQMYWKSVLPNTPMPKAIKDLLNTRAWDDGIESTYIDQPEVAYSSYVASKYEVNDEIPQSYMLWFSASKYEVNDQVPQSYMLWFSASRNQLKDQHIIKLLFLENDLYQGGELKLQFLNNAQKTAFLPKIISDSIPFSPKELPEIYNKFSVKPDSKEAKIIKQVLSLCDNKILEGEEMFCATSLESMIEFAARKLGKQMKALSTEVNVKGSTPLQKYKIEVVKKLVTNKVVICHRESYAYAVFYCHVSVKTRPYAVSLEGADGTKVKSVAVCHTDTSKWNPNHLAFELLNVTQGTVPVCHFVPEDHVIWVPYN